MAKAKRKKSSKKKAPWCVFSGKTKKISCHKNKAAAKKAVRKRHARGLKARLKRGKR
jgi:hypothetical protein